MKLSPDVKVICDGLTDDDLRQMIMDAEEAMRSETMCCAWCGATISTFDPEVNSHESSCSFLKVKYRY